jgi:hypothetical protein
MTVTGFPNSGKNDPGDKKPPGSSLSARVAPLDKGLASFIWAFLNTQIAYLVTLGR